MISINLKEGRNKKENKEQVKQLENKQKQVRFKSNYINSPIKYK